MSVYFVQQQGGERLIKIGFSDLPDKRVSTIRRLQAEDVSILAVIDGGREVERMLHAQHADDRRNGEWFSPSQKVLQTVHTAQMASSPKRHKSETASYDETAEDMRIAHEMIHEAVIKLGGTHARYATVEKIILPRLLDINPMWTGRRLRGLYGKENTNVPHWVVRNMTELLNDLRDEKDA